MLEDELESDDDEALLLDVSAWVDELSACVEDESWSGLFSSCLSLPKFHQCFFFVLVWLLSSLLAADDRFWFISAEL